MKTIFAFSLALIVTSCYRTPGPQDYNLNPETNSSNRKWVSYNPKNEKPPLHEDPTNESKSTSVWSYTWESD